MNRVVTGDRPGSLRRAVWLLLCGACLPIAALKPDGGILWIAPLVILTFPSGLLMLLACTAILTMSSAWEQWMSGETSWSLWASVGVVWILIVGSGYAQWFVLLPWIGRRWDRLSSRQRSEPAIELEEP